MINRIGNWDKVTSIINNLENEAKKASDISVKRWGLTAERIAKKHISAQDLGWQALSQRYLDSKVKKGYSNNILVRTSSYFQSITSWTMQGYAFVGVKREAKDSYGNVIANIAAVHECGSITANIPARPLWKPTLEEMKKEMAANPQFYNSAQIMVKNLQKY